MSKQTNTPKDNLRKDFSIKPFYTTSELRSIIKYKTNHGTKNFLLRLNVPCKIIGKNHYWFLSDIQTFSPTLFASICESSNMNNIIAKQPAFEVDDEFYTANQF